MSFKTQLGADQDVFLKDTEFGNAATLTVGSTVTPISVQFFGPAEVAVFLTGGMETTAPWALAKSSDVGSVVEGSSTIEIAGITYYIINMKPYEDDGAFKMLILSQDAP
jgi:hypothetical protein